MRFMNSGFFINQKYYRIKRLKMLPEVQSMIGLAGYINIKILL